MNAIDELKSKIKEKGGDMSDKDFDKIMKQKGSKQGLDPEKGKRTERRTNVLDQIKNKGQKPGTTQDAAPFFAKAKKGEAGRVGAGRFNRQFAMEKEKLLQGNDKNKPSDASRTNNGFKSKFNKAPPSTPQGKGQKKWKPSNSSKGFKGAKKKFGGGRRRN